MLAMSIGRFASEAFYEVTLLLHQLCVKASQSRAPAERSPASKHLWAFMWYAISSISRTPRDNQQDQCITFPFIIQINQ